MLRHEEPTEEEEAYPTVPVSRGAAEVRVTPQELADAVAAIEARRDAHAYHQASTIGLGEAIQQLGLNITPEELLAEVESRKRSTVPSHTAAATPVIVTQGRAGTRGGPLLIAAAGTSALFLLISFATLRAVSPTPPAVASVAAANTSAPTMSMDLRPLGSLEVGHSAYADLATVQSVARGKPPASVKADFTIRSEGNPGNLWEIVRKPDGFYVRTWAAPQDAVAAANGNTALVNLNQESTSTARAEVPFAAFKNFLINATDGNNAPIGVTVNFKP